MRSAVVGGRCAMHDAKRIRSSDMRITFVIDDDILAAAKQLAARDRKSVGEVISALARRGLERGSRATQAERNGVPLLPTLRGSVPVTPDVVHQLRDELT
jgi:hypothetical protein